MFRTLPVGRRRLRCPFCCCRFFVVVDDGGFSLLWTLLCRFFLLLSTITTTIITSAAFWSHLYRYRSEITTSHSPLPSFSTRSPTRLPTSWFAKNSSSLTRTVTLSNRHLNTQKGCWGERRRTKRTPDRTVFKINNLAKARPKRKSFAKLFQIIIFIDCRACLEDAVLISDDWLSNLDYKKNISMKFYADKQKNGK